MKRLYDASMLPDIKVDKLDNPKVTRCDMRCRDTSSRLNCGAVKRQDKRVE